MKKILATTLAAALLMSTAAHADGYYYRHEYRGGGGGGNWVAPLVGGLIVGGVLGAIAQPRYYQEIPAYHTECRREPLYDQWGNFMGYQRQCYNVPNS